MIQSLLDIFFQLSVESAINVSIDTSMLLIWKEKVDKAGKNPVSSQRYWWFSCTYRERWRFIALSLSFVLLPCCFLLLVYKDERFCISTVVVFFSGIKLWQWANIVQAKASRNFSPVSSGISNSSRFRITPKSIGIVRIRPHRRKWRKNHSVDRWFWLQRPTRVAFELWILLGNVIPRFAIERQHWTRSPKNRSPLFVVVLLFSLVKKDLCRLFSHFCTFGFDHECEPFSLK